VWPPQLLTNLFYRQKTAWLLCEGIHFIRKVRELKWGEM
jgi:hypothetical protein